MGLVPCASFFPSPGVEVRQVALSIRDRSGWRGATHGISSPDWSLALVPKDMLEDLDLTLFVLVR